MTLMRNATFRTKIPSAESSVIRRKLKLSALSKTPEGYTVCLRSFLRYLHGSGRTALDLSGTVIGPRIYDDEQIPSALRPEEVQTVVEEATRQDCSPIGRRDYAFLMLLA